MAEDKYKFYLNDRWFHLIKEHDDILKYASNVNKPTEGIIIEKHISDNSLDIFFYIKNKLHSKISVSDITQGEIFFHYKDIESHLTKINGEDYANLMLEAFSHIKAGNKSAVQVAIINKKRNLRRLCYKEPMFPLDVALDIRNFSISSLPFDYYLKLVDDFKIYIPTVKELDNSNNLSSNSTIKELIIPGSIFLIDRDYTLIGENLGKIHYMNTEDSVSNLTINYDYFRNYMESVYVNFKNYSDKRVINNCTCKMYKNEYNGVTVEFFNSIKENMNINSMPVEGASYKYIAKYDEAHNQVSNCLEITAKRKKKIFYSHPTFTTTYVDELGNSYHIANQNFARLHGMASFSTYAFDELEKKLIK